MNLDNVVDQSFSSTPILPFDNSGTKAGKIWEAFDNSFNGRK